MDTQEKETLRQNQINISRDLEPRDVVFHLLQEGILTDNDVELVSNGPTRRDRCQTLLSMLPRRGPTAYGTFKQALHDTKYDHLGDLLKPFGNNEHQVLAVSKTDVYDECTCKPYLPDITNHNNLIYYQFLDKYCCLLVNNLEPKDIIDYFYASGLFNDDQCERIQKGVTRKDRCKTFLYFLVRLPTDRSLPVLQQSLRQKYDFIADEITPFCTSVQTKVLTDNGTLLDRGISERNGVVEQSDSVLAVRPTDHLSPYHHPSNDLSRSLKTDPKSSAAFNKVDDQMYITKRSSCVKRNASNCENKPLVQPQILIHPGAIAPFELPSKKLMMAFNHMSSLINQGQYQKFDVTASKLQCRYNKDPDMSCLISYLKASRFLFGNQFDDAKKEIKQAFDIVPKTSNPKYFTVELFTAKTRMYITQKKLNKLEDALTDVKQIIETDPVGCTGRAAGWLYMNDARSKTTQLSMINLNKPNGITLYNMWHKMAQESFLKALTNFSKDGGKDGPFGCGYAICRLAILLLRCGDNGLNMGINQPCPEDITLAGMYLRSLEESPIPMPSILEMHYRLAKCDYFFRQGNTVRALEHADSAYNISTDLNLMEFTEHAHNRLLYLNTKTPVKIEEITDEEEVMNFLLEESQ